MIQWFKDLIGSGDPRTHALIAIMIAATLCISMLILVIAAACKVLVYGEIVVVSGALMGTATLIYNKGKNAEVNDAKS